jgi:hypothetical protein
MSGKRGTSSLAGVDVRTILMAEELVPLPLGLLSLDRWGLGVLGLLEWHLSLAHLDLDLERLDLDLDLERLLCLKIKKKSVNNCGNRNLFENLKVNFYFLKQSLTSHFFTGYSF